MRSCWNNNGARNKEIDISDSMAFLVLIISPQDQSLQLISVVQMVFRTKGRARSSRLPLSLKFIYRQNQRLQDLYRKEKLK